MSLPAFSTDEILTNESTRSARLKWVIVVDDTVPRGRLANAIACVAASVGHSVDGLIGQGGADADDIAHAGLPWAGCSILAASSEQLEDIRKKASANDSMFVSDMPSAAQTSRVYDEYLAELATETDPHTIAVAVVGPRNSIDRLVKRLSLLD